MENTDKTKAVAEGIVCSSKNKQTAVDWLWDNLTSHYPHIKELKLTIGLAKDMEKEQIMDAYNQGSYDMADKVYNPERYYNETYKTKNHEVRNDF